MIALPPETIASFLQAARERFAEGSLLLGAGHSSGSVYLFGYVAELTIKAVVYRHFGYGLNHTIKGSDRKAIEKLMKEETLAPKDGHDILKWAKWLVLKKGPLTGTPYPQAYGLEIEYHADFLDTWWSPSLRYHVLSLSFTDAILVQTAARWFLTEEPNM